MEDVTWVVKMVTLALTVIRVSIQQVLWYCYRYIKRYVKVKVKAYNFYMSAKIL